MRKLGLLLLFLLFTMILAGCGGNTGNDAKETEQQGESVESEDIAGATLLDQIKEKGELVIGTEGTYRPFSFHDKAGELTGFDVEIAREVAKRLDVEPVFQETQWDAIFAGLDAKRFDMIANQVGIRPDRQEKYDFSNPYISSAAVLVVHKDNNQVKSFEDVKGLKSAQSLTSNYRDIAESHGAQIEAIPGLNEAVELIASKRVDATFNDKLGVLDYLKQKPNAPIKIVATAEDASQMGLMFRKGNPELVEAVNVVLQEMFDDGTYLGISEKWFGEDVSK